MVIETRYHGPTDYKGSRVSASLRGWHERKRVVADWDHAISSDANHNNIAKRLADREGILGVWAGGPTDTGVIYVRIGQHKPGDVRSGFEFQSERSN